MKRRLVIVGGLVLVTVLALVSVSTARAWQLSHEDAAHAQLHSGRASAWNAVHRAALDGVAPSSLAPIRARLMALDAVSAPASFPLLGTSRQHFYIRQARLYRGVTRRVAAVEQWTMTLGRRDLANKTSSLQRVIVQGQRLDVPLPDAARTAAAARARMASARTPRELSAQAENVRASMLTASQAVEAQKAAISRELTRAARAGGMMALAKRDVASVDSNLAMLALFSPSAAVYRQQLADDVRMIGASRDRPGSALLGLRIDRDSAAAHAAYNRIVPSKFILVSTERESATLYQMSRPVFSTPVTTGGPELPTDHGVFHIYEKLSNFTFHSPWPPTSPFYYSPSFVQYWMPFYGGEGLHDASWRSNFGPGSNLQPTDLGGGRSILGTHGCVNLPASAAAYIWNWAPLGTAVVVI